MTAYLAGAARRRSPTLQMDAADFLALVRQAAGLAPRRLPVARHLPKGATLEGYLAAGLYRVLPDTTAEELVRKMLDRFYEDRRTGAPRRSPRSARHAPCTRS